MSPIRRIVLVPACSFAKQMNVKDKTEERLTNSSGLDHVANGEPLYGLVLGRASRAVRAPNRFDVAAALLVTPATWCCQY